MRSGISILLAIMLLIVGCKSTSDIDYSKIDYDKPSTVIYQMKADYSALVPVVLNTEKTKVVAYPGPKDLFNKEGELRFPLPLDKEFYLDEIGVGLNTAYISLTIDVYSHMLQAPTKDSLFKLIVEKDPFIQMYNLGNRKQYIDNQDLIKEIVTSRKYKNYKKLK